MKTGNGKIARQKHFNKGANEMVLKWEMEEFGCLFMVCYCLSIRTELLLAIESTIPSSTHCGWITIISFYFDLIQLRKRNRDLLSC